MADKSTAKKGECSCCYEARTDAGLEPRTLIPLPNTTCGFNKRKQPLRVYVCSNCDAAPKMS